MPLAVEKADPAIDQDAAHRPVRVAQDADADADILGAAAEIFDSAVQRHRAAEPFDRPARCQWTAPSKMFRGSPDDVSVGAGVLRDPDRTVRGILVNRQVSFFESEWLSDLHRGADPAAVAAEVELSRFCRRATGVLARRGLERGGEAFGRRAGVARSRGVPCGCPGRGAAIDRAPGRANRSRTSRPPGAGCWRQSTATFRAAPSPTVSRRALGQPKQLPLPEHASVHLVGASDRDDRAFLDVAGYLTRTLCISPTAGAGTADAVKSLPPRFDASSLVVEQFEATSKDGTKVPYFVVRPKALTLDGTAPTLLYGYGGFQVSLTPAYAGALGKLWLEQGGVYVVANIRGGGEFGPAWHQAGAEARTAARLRRLHRRRRGSDRAARSPARAASASWAARTAAC